MSDKFDSHAFQTCVDDPLTTALVGVKASLYDALKFSVLLLLTRIGLDGFCLCSANRFWSYMVIGFCIPSGTGEFNALLVKHFLPAY